MDYSFGVIIKRALEIYGKTQAELAGDLGISAPRLNNYINGRSYPPVDMLMKIGDILDLPLDYLIGRDNVKINCTPVDITSILSKYNTNTNSDTVSTYIKCYKSVSDPSRFDDSNVFDHFSILTQLPADKKGAYSLIISDHSMSPSFLKGDMVAIAPVDFDPEKNINFRDIYSVKI